MRPFLLTIVRLSCMFQELRLQFAATVRTEQFRDDRGMIINLRS